MRIEEIDEGDAAQKRVDRMKANAKAAKDRAKQMKAQADANAEQLKMRQSRQKLSKLRQKAVTSTIKPHA
jgi:hypothetical protein